MKTTQNLVAVTACAALLYALTPAMAMAGPHSGNTGGVNPNLSRGISVNHIPRQQNPSSLNRISGQRGTLRTTGQNEHRLRTESRIQENHARTYRGTAAGSSSGQIRVTETRGTRIQSDRGAGSSHDARPSTPNRESRRGAF